LLRETEKVPLAVRPDGIEDTRLAERGGLFIDVPAWYPETSVGASKPVVGCQ
jgi:hypothetical protein